MRVTEILDRAIDINVRKFPTFAAILAVFEIPYLVLTVENGGQIDVYTERAARFGVAAAAHDSDIAHSTLAFVAALLLEFIVGPLAGAALIVSNFQHNTSRTHSPSQP